MLEQTLYTNQYLFYTYTTEAPHTFTDLPVEYLPRKGTAQVEGRLFVPGREIFHAVRSHQLPSLRARGVGLVLYSRVVSRLQGFQVSVVVHAQGVAASDTGVST